MRLERGPTLGELLAAGELGAGLALRLLGQVVAQVEDLADAHVRRRSTPPTRRGSCTATSVESHVRSVFRKLGLPRRGTHNRRVLAVLMYVSARDGDRRDR